MLSVYVFMYTCSLLWCIYIGIRDSFAAFWGKVAQEFDDNPFVIGYEILNEPWAGKHCC